jgi:mRNA-degrading endonuclease toxin of MazEF toxin-antitoxin module
MILADQVRSLDWKVRQASFCCTLNKEVVHDVLNKLGALIDDWAASNLCVSTRFLDMIT